MWISKQECDKSELVVEYLNEIYDYLRQFNSSAAILDRFLQDHTLAKYVMELSLVNYKFTHSAAASALSSKVLDPDEKSIQELWTPT